MAGLLYHSLRKHGDDTCGMFQRAYLFEAVRTFVSKIALSGSVDKKGARIGIKVCPCVRPQQALQILCCGTHHNAYHVLCDSLF